MKAMNKKRDDISFYLYFVLFTGFILGALCFWTFSKICFKLSLRITSADIVIEGSAIKILPKGERRYDNLLKKVVFKTSDTYIKIFFPELKNLPRKVNLPITHKIVPDNLNAYSKKIRKEYVGQACVVFTPYVHYAPAPGYVGGAFHNIQQFRYPQDLTKKLENEIRIFITGGSVAWGFLAPDDKSTISGFLEDELKKIKFGNFTYKVINAAYNGFTTTDERIWIFNRITEFEPDIIISFSGFNDIYYVYHVSQDLFNSLHNEGSYFFCLVQEYEYFNNRGLAVKLTPDFSKLFYSPSDFPRKTIKNIHIISSYLNSIGVKYVFVLQPFNSKNPPEVIEMAKILEENLKENSAKIGFKFISYLDLFKNREDLFLDLCHFGDIGYKIIAENLAKDLKPIILNVIKEKEKKCISNMKKRRDI